jgi:hypothetical protein
MALLRTGSHGQCRVGSSMKIGDLVKYHHKNDVGMIVKVCLERIPPGGVDGYLVMWPYTRRSGRTMWFVHRDWVKLVQSA